jgi:hypothetical protein
MSEEEWAAEFEEYKKFPEYQVATAAQSDLPRSIMQHALAVQAVPNAIQPYHVAIRCTDLLHFQVHNSTMTVADFKPIFYWEYSHRMWGTLRPLLPKVFDLLKDCFVMISRCVVYTVARCCEQLQDALCTVARC